jgi:hypothetical protein
VPARKQSTDHLEENGTSSSHNNTLARGCACRRRSILSVLYQEMNRRMALRPDSTTTIHERIISGENGKQNRTKWSQGAGRTRRADGGGALPRTGWGGARAAGGGGARAAGDGGARAAGGGGARAAGGGGTRAAGAGRFRVTGAGARLAGGDVAADGAGACTRPEPDASKSRQGRNVWQVVRRSHS